MPLLTTVVPGVTITDETPLTPGLLNLLGTPAVTVTGTLDGTAGLAALSVTNAHLQDDAVTARVVDDTASYTMAGLTVNGPITASGGTGTLAVTAAASFNGNVTLGASAADTLDFKGSLGSATTQKTSPIDADKLIIADSAAADAWKWATRSDFAKTFLNLQSVHVAGTQSLTPVTWQTVTGLTVAITPRSTSSTILLVALVTGGFNTAGAQIYTRFARNDGVSDTVIGSGTAAGSRQAIQSSIIDAGGNSIPSAHMLYVDSPNTTSARTYKVQVYPNNAAGVWYIGRSSNDTDTSAFARAGCYLLALEIP
jgi:hypothetical protein